MRHIDASRFGRFFTRAAGLLALGLVLLLGAREGEAKLHPYYVVKGSSFGQISPRILFVLDTSGSMAWKAQKTPQKCVHGECETAIGGSGASRIATARYAIKQVVIETADQAKFAFMTFDQQRPPTSVPGKCAVKIRRSTNGTSWSDAANDSWRFFWVDQYDSPSISGDLSNLQHNGSNGMYILCDSYTNKGYPYLRWDNVGKNPKPGVAQNNPAGAVPSSPLISMAANNFKPNWGNNAHNYDRKVQWFDRFLGVRFHVDCSVPALQQLSDDSTGDWGSNFSDKDTNVCGNTFYYWPYVDGFPGYSHVRGWAPDYTQPLNYFNGGYFYGWRDGVNGQLTDDLGVIEVGNNAGALYGPFYLELDPNEVNPNYWGPADEAEADQMLLNHVSTMTEGGVDADGGTPWTDVVGPIPQSPIKNNAIFSHSTVASYLKFVQNIETPDQCAPTAAVLITDGEPNCYQNNTGCSKLYGRLSNLRRELDVTTYVVGFFVDNAVINEMACAAAGSCTCNGDTCCTDPCGGTPVKNWDTCQDAANWKTGCSFLAGSPDELVEVLTNIITGILQTDVASGPGTALNDFDVQSANPDDDDSVQTKINGFTTWPDWKGNVTKEICNSPDIYDIDDDGNTTELAPYCELPNPQFQQDELEETFGPCAQSRVWDAGECLKQTDWKARRIYSNDANNDVYRISDATGKATAKFIAELTNLGLVGGANAAADAHAITAFILGKDWPDGYKLPGLANSAPIVVRRVPEYDEKLIPSVPIRDPHCAGRFLDSTQNADIPQELIDYAEEAWDPANKIMTPSEHWEYQEAVVVGDDLGVVHAFQLNSGNELFGYIPRFLLDSAKAQYDIGPDTRGQPDDLDNHIFGVSNTLNHGWIFDDNINEFRHVGIIGIGKGGQEYVVLDLGHMSPESSDGPFEVLWTTEDAAVKNAYDKYLGETWARPALTYTVDPDDLITKPTSHFVMGSGYQDDPFDGNSVTGRTLLVVDALDGSIEETAAMPKVTTPVYESSFGAVVDPAVASHCISRFWAEQQETYIPDPAGRLFRWDLGRDTNHESDSSSKWNGAAKPVFRFPACQGTGSSCTIAAGNKGDPFMYAAAVTALDRIDIAQSDAGAAHLDQFLVALNSGSPYDDKLDWSRNNNDFHPSLYLMVDDHSGANKNGGFTIPAGAPRTAVGADESFMRLVISDIERVRTFTPVDGQCVENLPPDVTCADGTYTETRNFSRRARPIRAPKITVTGVQSAAGEILTEFEIMEVEYTIFEPGPGECDPKFYDEDLKEWIFDEGSTYTLTLRLVVADDKGFRFKTGTGGSVSLPNIPDGLHLKDGGPVQQTGGSCEDGICGPDPGDKAPPPCDNNMDNPMSDQVVSLPVNRAELIGFDPVE